MSSQQKASATSPVEPAQPRRGWMLTVMCLAVALVIATVASVYSALPSLARATGASETGLTWVVDAYTLVLAVLLLPAGALGDRYGRRGVLLIGLAVFSLGCAAPVGLNSIPLLIACRAVTGMGAALVMPATLSLITSGFPIHQRGLAVGLWAGTAGGGGFGGLVATGVLLQWFSWHSVFAFSAVSGALIFLASWTVPRVTSTEPGPPVDILGAAVSCVALTALIFGIIEAPTYGWASKTVLGSLVIGVVLLGVFVVVELWVRHPLLDIRLFTHAGFGSGALALTMQFLATFGVLYALSQHLQFVLGYTPLGTGVAVLPVGGLLLPLAVFSPWLTTRIGMKYVLTAGFVLLAGSMLGLSQWDSAASYTPSLIGLLIFGAGVGLSATPATTAIIESVPPEKHGVASAVNDTTREVGAALGIAVTGTLLTSGYTTHVRGAASVLPVPLREPATNSVGVALNIAERLGPTGPRLAAAVRSAFVLATEHTYLVLGIVLGVTALLLLVWAPGRSRQGDPSLGAPETESIASSLT